MRTLWTFGCSFTAEYYPVGFDNIRSLYDDYKEWKGGELPQVWPTLLSKKLNFKLKNLGWGGDSNYAIFNNFLEVCDKIKEGDIVIFGWTHVARFHVSNMTNNKFQQILPSSYDYPETNLSSTTIKEILLNRTGVVWLEEVHNWIKLINLFLDKLNVNVFHWTSDHNIFNKRTKFIDKKKFIIVTDENFSFNDSLMSYISHINRINGKEVSKIADETNGKILDAHFGEHGHIFQSEYFYKHIKKYIK